MDSKNIFNFFYSVVETLSKGSLIKRVSSFFFSLIGVLNFFGGGYFFCKFISYVPDFWSAILLFLFFLSSFLSLQIWFYRAKAIKNLEDSEFTVIPIFSNLFRALGENYALFLITIGLGGILMLWFSDYYGHLRLFVSYIPFVSLSYTFIGGLLFLIITTIIAFLVLLFTYFLAENILVLVQIAKNTSGIKKTIIEEK